MSAGRRTNDASETFNDIRVTTVESNALRPLVQPYSERPVLELSPGSVACKFCGNSRFRRSRIRFTDLPELLLLRYPVRCMRCSQRQFNMLYVALMAFPPKSTAARVAASDSTASWQNWTDAAASGQATRPLSTAMGPRAERLGANMPQARQADLSVQEGMPSPGQPASAARERTPSVQAAPAQPQRTGPPPRIPSRREDSGIW